MKATSSRIGSSIPPALDLSPTSANTTQHTGMSHPPAVPEVCRKHLNRYRLPGKKERTHPWFASMTNLHCFAGVKGYADAAAQSCSASLCWAGHRRGLLCCMADIDSSVRECAQERLTCACIKSSKCGCISIPCGAHQDSISACQACL